MNNDIDAIDLAIRSRVYRKTHGLNQRQLAALVKTSPGVIGELEREKVRSRRVAQEIIALTTEA